MTENTLLENTFLGSKWFNPDYLFNQGVSFFHDLSTFTFSPEALYIFHTILFFFALFFLTIIVYSTIRVFEIRSKEDGHLEHELKEYAHKIKEHQEKKEQGEAISKNARWVKALNYLFSDHSSDWKLAIIEADAMLDFLLDQLGFKGDSLGDKLKYAAEPAKLGIGKFRHLTMAWEVHTIRNKIAHEGDSFQLSHHEAKRVIALYEQIFRDYGYI